MSGHAPRSALHVVMLLAGVAGLVPAAAARDTLGVYHGWAAFRDAERCYAIAQPQIRRPAVGDPFVGIGTWPGRGLRSSLYVRLSRAVQPGLPVTLTVGERRFRLSASGMDAHAADAASDRAIAAALRSGRSMSVEAVGVGGHPFADTYALAGAATAMDAAALACAALR